MRLLDRYLLRELMIPLGYCLGGFLIFWISFDLFADLNMLQEHKLRFLDVVAYYAVKIPEFLVLILPIALLFALLYCLTNHARHNELTAMRAAGVGLWRICVPYLAVGLILGVALFLINEYWAPNTVDNELRILNRRLENKDGAAQTVNHVMFENARDGTHWLIGAFNPVTGRLTDVHVDWSDENQKHALHAATAERVQGVWTFYDVRENRGTEKLSLHTNILVMPELQETPEQIRREIKFSNRLKTPLVQSAEIPITEILDYLDLHPDASKAVRASLLTQLNDRLAKPWTCLVVVLIAIPFGAASGRRNLFVGVASSIVIVFVYFVLMKVGMAMGAGGHLTPWIAAWLPNLCFTLAALWMMRRVR